MNSEPFPTKKQLEQRSKKIAILDKVTDELLDLDSSKGDVRYKLDDRYFIWRDDQIYNLARYDRPSWNGPECNFDECRTFEQHFNTLKKYVQKVQLTYVNKPD